MASMAPFFFLYLFALVAGYSFDITSEPTQCGPLSLRITEGRGKPPYTALVVPFGPPPGSVERRKVIQHEFSADSTSFILPYPSDSDFVVMLSDSDGVGTGGTSVPTNVGVSGNSSCLSNDPSILFFFDIFPNNAINQCQQTTLAWENNSKGTVTFLLVIPGGQSFSIPVVNPGPTQGNTTGFLWTPNVPARTNVILVAGDSRGPGTGGSINTAIGSGDPSCLDNSSPSSTAGTPAGAVRTGRPTSGDSNNGSDSTDVGAVVGGVVGAIAAVIIVILLMFFFLRIRRRRRRHARLHRVDLLTDDIQDVPDQFSELYRPEPYMVSTYSHTSTGENGGLSTQRLSTSDVAASRDSSVTTTDHSDGTHGTTTGTMDNVQGPAASTLGGSTGYASEWSRKSLGVVLRPVNIMQHEDAGEAPQSSGSGGSNKLESVELPPSYTSVRAAPT